MATKTAQAQEQETETQSQDGPVLDMSDAAVKKLIKTAKQRGFVTYDELNEVLPSEEVSSEQIEDTMSMLSDMGINVIDSDDAEEAAGPVENWSLVLDAPRRKDEPSSSFEERPRLFEHPDGQLGAARAAGQAGREPARFHRDLVGHSGHVADYEVGLDVIGHRIEEVALEEGRLVDDPLRGRVLRRDLGRSVGRVDPKDMTCTELGRDDR